jgi:hypothetical protein
MTRLLLLLTAMLFEEMFRFFPNYTEADICDYKNPENGWGFLFSDMIVSPEYYVYIFSGYIGKIIVAGVLFYSWADYRVAMWCFLILNIADMIDFCLTFSTPWFGPFPTFNHLKIGFFGLSMLYEKYGK